MVYTLKQSIVGDMPQTGGFSRYGLPLHLLPKTVGKRLPTPVAGQKRQGKKKTRSARVLY